MPIITLTRVKSVSKEEPEHQGPIVKAGDKSAKPSATQSKAVKRSQNEVKTIENLEAQIAILRADRSSIAISSTLNTLIKWGAFVLISRYVYMSVDSMAGQKTVADIGIKVLGNLQVSQSVAWLTGMGGVAYGAKERTLRKKNSERQASRITELENRIDSDRSSSNLTSRGDTRPEDILE